jgi:hypothetical protein
MEKKEKEKMHARHRQERQSRMDMDTATDTRLPTPRGRTHQRTQNGELAGTLQSGPVPSRRAKAKALLLKNTHATPDHAGAGQQSPSVGPSLPHVQVLPSRLRQPATAHAAAHRTTKHATLRERHPRPHR